MFIQKGQVVIGSQINGSNIVIGNGNSVSVVQSNGRTLVNGVDVTEQVSTELKKGVLGITIEAGMLVSIESDVSVVAQDVSGDVVASGSVSCNNVGRDVKASGSVNCGRVGGNVKASGSVMHS